jgi:hypothetical protein
MSVVHGLLDEWGKSAMERRRIRRISFRAGPWLAS